MESIHYYHDYLEQCYNTIEKLSTDLHNIYVRRNNLANICYANLNLLESNGITKEIIEKKKTPVITYADKKAVKK